MTTETKDLPGQLRAMYLTPETLLELLQAVEQACERSTDKLVHYYRIRVGDCVSDLQDEVEAQNETLDDLSEPAFVDISEDDRRAGYDLACM